MQRYFASVKDDAVFLSSADEHQLLHVLRATRGFRFEVVAAGRLYLAELSVETPFAAKVVSILKAEADSASVTLIYALPKGDKLDLVIQKATELGVKAIMLVPMKRSIARWTAADFIRKKERLNIIAKEAGEQCKRVNLPLISFMETFSEALYLDVPQKLMASETECGKTPLDVKLDFAKEVAVLVGPEGGFDPAETEAALKAGFIPVSLGRHILRTETAAIVAVALLGYLYDHALA